MDFQGFLEQISRAPDVKKSVDKLELSLRRVIAYGKSPSKSLEACKSAISNFVAKEKIQATIIEMGGRGLECRLFIPERQDAGVSYNFAIGLINTRTQRIEFKRLRPITLSLHALDRLCERMSTGKEDAIIEEIKSCFDYVIPWSIGAQEAGAVCWPLLTSNGFFVARRDDESNKTAAVTWLSNERLTKKWEHPERDLRRTSIINPHLVRDIKFARMFLATFPWMLHENITDDDHHKNGREPIGVLKDKDVDEDIERDLDLDLDTIGQETIRQLRLSSQYRSGVNYGSQPPYLRTYSEHFGTVIRATNHALIVYLESGLVGRIQTPENAYDAIPCEKHVFPGAGEKLEVVIKNIFKVESGGYFVIHLQEKKIADAIWARLIEACPIGSLQDIDVKGKRGKFYFGETKSSFPCLITEEEASSILGRRYIDEGDFPFVDIPAIVTAHDYDRRSLVVAGTETLEGNNKNGKGNCSEGDIVIGKVEKVAEGYCMVRLGPNCYGKCLIFNAWNLKFSEVGSECAVVLIEFNDVKKLWNIGLPRPCAGTLSNYIKSSSMREDENFYKKYFMGMNITAQVMCWLEKSKTFIVATEDGYPLSLPGSEITWSRNLNNKASALLSAGEVIELKVIKIEDKKKRVYVSKRARESDPFIFLKNSIDTGNGTFYGEVVDVQDYGYFVRLNNSEIEGLLHKSKIPENIKFKLGQIIKVGIEVVDVDKNRVSLTFTS